MLAYSEQGDKSGDMLRSYDVCHIILLGCLCALTFVISFLLFSHQHPGIGICLF